MAATSVAVRQQILGHPRRSSRCDDKISIYPGDDAIRIVTEATGVCGGCGCVGFIFVNRNGSTRCVHCDALQLQRETDSPHANS